MFLYVDSALVNQDSCRDKHRGMGGGGYWAIKQEEDVLLGGPYLRSLLWVSMLTVCKDVFFIIYLASCTRIIFNLFCFLLLSTRQPFFPTTFFFPFSITQAIVSTIVADNMLILSIPNLFILSQDQNTGGGARFQEPTSLRRPAQGDGYSLLKSQLRKQLMQQVCLSVCLSITPPPV